MNKKKLISGLIILSALMLCACGASEPTQAPTPTLAPTQTTAPTAMPAPTAVPTAEPEPTPTPVPELLIAQTPGDVENELYAAVLALRQIAPMDISSVAFDMEPELAVKNLYYGLTARFPEIKYAYDLEAQTENGILNCRVSYMPYMTGDWPESCAGAQEVSSAEELLRAAEAHIGAQDYPIRLTDTSLTPDDMSRVLQQAGGGYILCAMNRDATAITYSPAMGMKIEDCMALLEQADTLAAQIAAQVTDDSMTEMEKAQALYTYLTVNVQYDRRYYSDRSNMPYDSQTAIGALRDNLAICGGYSNALKLLFEQVGITCYNVTGKCSRENHMWNIARIVGVWLWFDATCDRGISTPDSFRQFALTELDTERYTWEQTWVDVLLK